MIRAPALVVSVCTALLALGVSLGMEPRLTTGSLRPQALETRACKPQGPIATSLEVLEVPGAEGLLSVRLEIEPQLDLAAVHWILELPPGLTALGETTGLADPRAHARTHHQLMLEITGALSGGPGAAELSLVVQGSLPGALEAGVFSRRSSVALRGAAPAEPTLRHFADADTGARSRVAVLPVAHRSGR